jgi:hypothetical protein
MKSNQKIKPVANKIRTKRSSSILNKSEQVIVFPEKLAIAEDILKKFPVPKKLLKTR